MKGKRARLYGLLALEFRRAGCHGRLTWIKQQVDMYLAGDRGPELHDLTLAVCSK